MSYASEFIANPVGIYREGARVTARRTKTVEAGIAVAAELSAGQGGAPWIVIGHGRRVRVTCRAGQPAEVTDAQWAE